MCVPNKTETKGRERERDRERGPEMNREMKI